MIAQESKSKRELVHFEFDVSFASFVAKISSLCSLIIVFN